MADDPDVPGQAQKLTERNADDTLKARILKGEVIAQFIWLLRGPWASLDSDVNPGAALLPIPEFMKELEVLSAGGSSQDALLSCIADCCVPVERKNATKIQEFKRAVVGSLRVCLMQIGPILTAAGISLACPNGAKGVPWFRPQKCTGLTAVASLGPPGSAVLGAV